MNLYQGATLEMTQISPNFRFMLSLVAVLAVAKAMSQTNAVLGAELQKRADRDQTTRKLVIKTPPTSPGYKTYLKQMAAVDKDNTARMRQIVRQYGWPGKTLVGQKGADAAFLLVQHADADKKFQRKCFPLILKALDQGEMRKPDAALFIDRVLVGEGKEQEYGSQWKWDTGNTHMAPYPIADPANVDTRRRYMGLMPLKEYGKLLEQVYKAQLSQPKKKGDSPKNGTR